MLLSLPHCQPSLPRLANSSPDGAIWGVGICVAKKIEFASLPRFLSRGVGQSARRFPGLFWQGRMAGTAPCAHLSVNVHVRPPANIGGPMLGGNAPWPCGHVGSFSRVFCVFAGHVWWPSWHHAWPSWQGSPSSECLKWIALRWQTHKHTTHNTH